MERVIVTQLLISAAKQQELFKIRLPRDSKRVTGICITTADFFPTKGREVGWLWLSSPHIGEGLYCDTVFANVQRYGITGLGWDVNQGLSDGSFWTSATKVEFASLNCPVTESVVEGFYSDQRAVLGAYSITIYLKVEL